MKVVEAKENNPLLILFSWMKTRGDVQWDNSQGGRVGDFKRCGCGLFEIDMMVSHYFNDGSEDKEWKD
jgi:hypothetical protein